MRPVDVAFPFSLGRIGVRPSVDREAGLVEELGSREVGLLKAV